MRLTFLCEPVHKPRKYQALCDKFTRFSDQREAAQGQFQLHSNDYLKIRTDEMEKASFSPGSLGIGRLITSAKKKKDRLLDKLVPGWTTSKIEAQLLIPKAQETKPVRLPRGFVQSRLNTKDGTIQIYATGNGPTVIFNHGWGGGADQAR